MRVYGATNIDLPLDKQRYYGQANFKLSKLINAENVTLKKVITTADKTKEVGGKLIILGQERRPDEEVSTISFTPVAFLKHSVDC